MQEKIDFIEIGRVYLAESKFSNILTQKCILKIIGRHLIICFTYSQATGKSCYGQVMATVLLIVKLRASHGNKVTQFTLH